MPRSAARSHREGHCLATNGSDDPLGVALRSRARIHAITQKAPSISQGQPCRPTPYASTHRDAVPSTSRSESPHGATRSSVSTCQYLRPSLDPEFSCAVSLVHTRGAGDTMTTTTRSNHDGFTFTEKSDFARKRARKPERRGRGCWRSGHAFIVVMVLFINSGAAFSMISESISLSSCSKGSMKHVLNQQSARSQEQECKQRRAGGGKIVACACACPRLCYQERRGVPVHLSLQLPSLCSGAWRSETQPCP
jgi:hypothetical protein